MNALMAIRPRSLGAVWVFDDEARGLKSEPFVGDINAMIDYLCLQVESQDITLIFGAHPFPGAMLHLERAETEHGGTWYFCRELGIRGWLCPALFKFFEEAPEAIYVKAERNK